MSLLATPPSLPPAPEVGTHVDAARFGVPLPKDSGIVWEDPREIHTVVITFTSGNTPKDRVKLEYWSSRWPEQRLPKDSQPGGGSVGWWELGNWHVGEWRTADTDEKRVGDAVKLVMNPLNAKEYPKLNEYPARFRYTLKIRVSAEEGMERPVSIAAYTDSVWKHASAIVAFKDPPRKPPVVSAYNGYILKVAQTGEKAYRIEYLAADNPDPNTFDRTLVTVNSGGKTFTFLSDELNNGTLFIPDMNAVVLPDGSRADYPTIANEQRVSGMKSLYTRVGEMNERTWRDAWNEMPPKRSLIYFVLGLDGGRQRFRLNSNGELIYRTNDHYLRARAGDDTPRLDLMEAPAQVSFELPDKPVSRSIVDSSLPICNSEWNVNNTRITQEAFATLLDGTKNDGKVPAPDATTVCLLRFIVLSENEKDLQIVAPHFNHNDKPLDVAIDETGLVRLNGNVIGCATKTRINNGWSILVKIPYVPLTEPTEIEALKQLDFDKERIAVAEYWKRRLDQSASLKTPEENLNSFYRAHAGHLLMNCEREPNADRRFARVGSFSYGAYGNESCMMVVDLDRRGYHDEARECLDAWLHYQSSVGLPGDFSTKEGVLYGAGGYEAGGYNQHHGWILWCLAEHYRFTRDNEWLKRSANGILKATDWIVNERARTANRTDIAKGLLPSGSLEDIGDWWPWLSTNCYTWRGLDSAAWALDQIHHPEAARLRREAADYKAAILKAFRTARDISPVVRLRDGTAVPHIPSHPYRRGRSFGWICETLEGALHLLITGVIDAKSPEAAWILKDYEDNLYLSNQYGYTVPDFENQWFSRGGISMQACLLLDVEPYLYRDDVKQALRSMFNGIAVGYFPDVNMLTEHALPNPGDWAGDHYKSSDEANACGWLRYLFIRENGDELIVGQAIPHDWLKSGERCGMKNAATWFGPMSVMYEAGNGTCAVHLDGPLRNPPKVIRLRFRDTQQRPLKSVKVNGKVWRRFKDDWVSLPGDIGKAEIAATW